MSKGSEHLVGVSTIGDLQNDENSKKMDDYVGENEAESFLVLPSPEEIIEAHAGERKEKENHYEEITEHFLGDERKSSLLMQVPIETGKVDPKEKEEEQQEEYYEEITDYSANGEPESVFMQVPEETAEGDSGEKKQEKMEEQQEEDYEEITDYSVNGEPKSGFMQVPEETAEGNPGEKKQEKTENQNEELSEETTEYSLDNEPIALVLVLKVDTGERKRFLPAYRKYIVNLTLLYLFAFLIIAWVFGFDQIVNENRPYDAFRAINITSALEQVCACCKNTK